MKRIFACSFGLLVMWTAAASGQVADEVGKDAAETPFAEETRVVAVDRMVGLGGEGGNWLRGGKLPRGIEVSDFRAVVSVEDASVELTPVGLERITRGLPERAEPWRVVVLVDAALASTRTVRWGCSLLAQHAAALTELGSVAVAVARPEPATVLAATSEPVLVEQMLSRLALVAEGDDAVLSRRWRWVEEMDADGAYEAAEAESFEVRAALDSRLLYWTEESRGAGARKLLLWLTDGFDVETAPFYGAASEPAASDGTTLADHARDLEQALAADGWIVLPLRPPEEDPHRGRAAGVRIGKWRFLGIPPFVVAGVRDPGYDPEQSEAYLQLGDARLAADDVEGAAKAYDLAYYHYWNEPKHDDRQAVALLRLADCLQRLDDGDGARRARALAARLDPEVAARHLTVDALDEASAVRPDVARRLDADAPLLRLAAATSGELVDGAEPLAGRLGELGRRLRLTVQLPPSLVDGVHRVEITWRDEAVRAPAWIRVGDAPALRDARERR